MSKSDFETMKDLMEFCIHYEQKAWYYMNDCENKRKSGSLEDEHMAIHAASFRKYLELADKELDQYIHYLKKHMEEAGEKWD